jgi:hypothetical protein
VDAGLKNMAASSSITGVLNAILSLLLQFLWKSLSWQVGYFFPAA